MKIRGVLSRGQGTCHHQARPAGAAHCCSGPHRQAAVAPGTPREQGRLHQNLICGGGAGGRQECFGTLLQILPAATLGNSLQRTTASFLSTSTSHRSASPWPSLTWNRMGKAGIPGNVISDVSETQRRWL